MELLEQLKVKIFADGADLNSIIHLHKNPLIKGFTTNPTLMKAAGVLDYTEFAHMVLQTVTDRPFSFEVFADDFDVMEEQALLIASWGKQVFVKIPVSNTRGQSSGPLVKRLAAAGVRMNVTAMMTLRQVEEALPNLIDAPHGYISIFAGRIADTGRDPLPIMKKAVEMLAPYPHLELIWASPREVLNIFQADSIGCGIITVTNDLLKKLPSVGKDLDLFSLDTVKMFYNDAAKAGYELAIPSLAAADSAVR